MCASHISGVGERAATASPERNRSSPPAVRSALTPASRIGRLSAARAAAGVWTTSRRSKPVGVTTTTRSVPGRTCAYVAVLPVNVGAGSRSGQPNATSRPASFSVAISPPGWPPADNTTSAFAAFGTTVPPDTTNVVSTGTQFSPRRTRRTPEKLSTVHVPVGLANVDVDSVRSEVTSIRRFSARAADCADIGSGRSAGPDTIGAGSAAAGAAIASRVPTGMKSTTVTVNTTASNTPRKRAGKNRHRTRERTNANSDQVHADNEQAPSTACAASRSVHRAYQTPQRKTDTASRQPPTHLIGRNIVFL